MSYLFDLVLIFTFSFITINRLISWVEKHLFEYALLFLNDNMDENYEKLSNSKSLVSGCWLAFAWVFANFTLSTAAYKSVAYIKKCVIIHTCFL